MIRKLVMLAITSGLAKKAWDAYQQKNAVAAGSSMPSDQAASTKSRSRKRSPAARAASSEGRPDAS